MTPLSYHSSNLSFIALETMQLVVLILINLDGRNGYRDLETDIETKSIYMVYNYLRIH